MAFTTNERIIKTLGASNTTILSPTSAINVNNISVYNSNTSAETPTLKIIHRDSTETIIFKKSISAETSDFLPMTNFLLDRGETLSGLSNTANKVTVVINYQRR